MKSKILAITLAATLVLSGAGTMAMAAEAPEDVTPVLISAPIYQYGDLTGHWAESVVEDLAARGALPYYGVKFFPDVAITKSEFAMMLHDVLGIQIAYFVAPDIGDYFNDVSADAGYAADVIDLVTVGVFESGGNFGPDDILSREDLVHFIMMAYRYEMGDGFEEIKIGAVSFADADSVSADYSGDVARAQHDGLIIGNGNNTFQPERAATRAEAAAVVSRLAGLLEAQELMVTVVPVAVLSDDAIVMKITITNNAKKDVNITFSSGQRFDFELQDADGNALYRWSADKSFILMTSTTTIAAGETLVLGDTLSGDTFEGIKDKIAYMTAFVTGEASFINNEGYTVAVVAVS